MICTSNVSYVAAMVVFRWTSLLSSGLAVCDPFNATNAQGTCNLSLSVANHQAVDCYVKGYTSCHFSWGSATTAASITPGCEYTASSTCRPILSCWFNSHTLLHSCYSLTAGPYLQFKILNTAGYLHCGYILASTDDHILRPVLDLNISAPHPSHSSLRSPSTHPSGLQTATSPEWNQPPANDFSVSSSFLRYPFMTRFPLTPLTIHAHRVMRARSPDQYFAHGSTVRWSWLAGISVANNTLTAKQRYRHALPSFVLCLSSQ